MRDTSTRAPATTRTARPMWVQKAAAPTTLKMHRLRRPRPSPPSRHYTSLRPPQYNLRSGNYTTPRPPRYNGFCSELEAALALSRSGNWTSVRVADVGGNVALGCTESATAL
eukprot:TRINITY_DN7532_c0_g3_i1.p2 TRINITY_DN7532_c0_g3~~TRINITY_DN7532_c0_g3_i1.p2  ORF type:complete len:112 (-),score=2.06 TRINITY_DN7532_c0_g3_i1:173-508(-)